MPVEVKKIEKQEDLEKAWALRQEVFVVEQGVDAGLEYEFEEESVHFLASVGNETAGTARWRKTDKGIKLERFAVKKQFRNEGVGSALLRALLKDLPASDFIYLHAQASAEPLYARNVFIRLGEPFEEAGIVHYKMKRQP